MRINEWIDRLGVLPKDETAASKILYQKWQQVNEEIAPGPLSETVQHLVAISRSALQRDTLGPQERSAFTSLAELGKRTLIPPKKAERLWGKISAECKNGSVAPQLASEIEDLGQEDNVDVRLHRVYQQYVQHYAPDISNDFFIHSVDASHLGQLITESFRSFCAVWINILRQLGIGFTEVDVAVLSLPEMQYADILPLYERVLLTLDTHQRALSNKPFLDLNTLKLTYVPPRLIATCTQITALVLSHNLLNRLAPEWLQGLTNLQHLKCDDNQITEIPPNLGNLLPKLSVLNLYNNKITCLAVTTFQGAPLTHCTLSNNQLTVLQAGLFHNVPLEELDVSNNQIARVEDALFQNVPIKTLKASYNRITAITTKIFEGAHALEELDLSHNLIENLTGFCLRDFGVLWKLSLAHNNLREISPEGWGINRITRQPTAQDQPRTLDLDLSYNQIQILYPSMFLGWGSLKINLSHNKIEQLPRRLFAGTTLEAADFSDNQITTLPSGVIPEIPYGRPCEDVCCLYTLFECLVCHCCCTPHGAGSNGCCEEPTHAYEISRRLHRGRIQDGILSVHAHLAFNGNPICSHSIGSFPRPVRLLAGLRIQPYDAVSGINYPTNIHNILENPLVCARQCCFGGYLPVWWDS